MSRDRFGFFDFEPTDPFVARALRPLLEEAERRCGRVHGVVLPEGALTEPEVRRLERLLDSLKISFYIAGVRGERQNVAQLGMHTHVSDRSWRTLTQHKHHRWCLDREQILTYHLGSALHASRTWWENIELKRRELNFVSANGWLTLCPLICEDLARQDPVAEVLRSVGPNLVIALLLDGPQLQQRWPARYATVLADDPGSSVLTVTSLGMVSRSRPRGAPASRVIGMWRDSRTGPHQLELAPNASALFLSLTAEYISQWTADGREERAAGELFLSGVEQLCG